VVDRGGDRCFRITENSRGLKADYLNNAITAMMSASPEIPMAIQARVLADSLSRRRSSRIPAMYFSESDLRPAIQRSSASSDIFLRFDIVCSLPQKPSSTDHAYIALQGLGFFISDLLAQFIESQRDARTALVDELPGNTEYVLVRSVVPYNGAVASDRFGGG